MKLGHFIPDLAFIHRAFAVGFPDSIEQSARALGITMMVFLISANNIERDADIARLGAWISFVGLSAMGLLIFVFARRAI